MASVGQQVSVSFGVAIGAMVVEMSEVLRGHAAPETADFAAAFVVVGLMSMASSLLMLRLPEERGTRSRGARCRRGRAIGEERLVSALVSIRSRRARLRERCPQLA